MARVRPRRAWEPLVATRGDHSRKCLATRAGVDVPHGRDRAGVRGPEASALTGGNATRCGWADVHQHAARACDGARPRDRARALEVRPQGRPRDYVRRLHEPRCVVLARLAPTGTVRYRMR